MPVSAGNSPLPLDFNGGVGADADLAVLGWRGQPIPLAPTPPFSCHLLVLEMAWFGAESRCRRCRRAARPADAAAGSGSTTERRRRPTTKSCG